MNFKSPRQKITLGLYIHNLGFLKNPAEYFANIIYDDHEYFVTQISQHKNIEVFKSIIQVLNRSDLFAFAKYLRLILPLKCNIKKKELKIIEDDWEQFLIEFESYNFLYKIDNTINHEKYLRIKKQLESTFSSSWQDSLKRVIKWPTTEAPLGIEQLFPNGWQESGLLSSCGYTVGKSGATETIRRAILSRLVEQDINFANFKSDYINSWGKTNSLERLLKIARTIAVLCRNAKGSPNDLKKAITEWESDLAFLKEKYFHTFLNLDNQKWPRT